jgi:hypothetical protein
MLFAPGGITDSNLQDFLRPLQCSGCSILPMVAHAFGNVLIAASANSSMHGPDARGQILACLTSPGNPGCAAISPAWSQKSLDQLRLNLPATPNVGAPVSGSSREDSLKPAN